MGQGGRQVTEELKEKYYRCIRMLITHFSYLFFQWVLFLLVILQVNCALVKHEDVSFEEL